MGIALNRPFLLIYWIFANWIGRIVPRILQREHGRWVDTSWSKRTWTQLLVDILRRKVNPLCPSSGECWRIPALCLVLRPTLSKTFFFFFFLSLRNPLAGSWQGLGEGEVDGSMFTTHLFQNLKALPLEFRKMPKLYFQNSTDNKWWYFYFTWTSCEAQLCHWYIWACYVPICDIGGAFRRHAVICNSLAFMIFFIMY